MHKKLKIITLCSTILLTGLALPGLAEDDNQVEVETYGFIRSDFFVDSRQTVSAREGAFLLYPANISKTETVADENSDSFLNFVSFISRVGVKVKAPDAFNAKISGKLEADFFGHQNDTISAFRLRHGSIKLDWGTTELLLGQDWSPLFTADVYPQTVSFGTGVPFNPFARNPQVRFTYKPFQDFKLYATAAMQRDAFAESEGSIKQQRAAVPAFHLNTEYGNDWFFIGAGGVLRTTRPEANSALMNSGAGYLYSKINLFEKLTLRLKGLYGNDMTDHLMLGGYVQTKENQFMPLSVASGWADLDYKLGGGFSLGVFGGYSANLGLMSGAAEQEKMFARSANIGQLFRISPRVTYTINNLKFGLELEHTGALYTTGFQGNLAPEIKADDKFINNTRLMFTSQLNF